MTRLLLDFGGWCLISFLRCAIWYNYRLVLEHLIFDQVGQYFLTKLEANDMTTFATWASSSLNYFRCWPIESLLVTYQLELEKLLPKQNNNSNQSLWAWAWAWAWVYLAELIVSSNLSSRQVTYFSRLFFTLATKPKEFRFVETLFASRFVILLLLLLLFWFWMLLLSLASASRLTLCVTYQTDKRHNERQRLTCARPITTAAKRVERREWQGELATISHRQLLASSAIHKQASFWPLQPNKLRSLCASAVSAWRPLRKLLASVTLIAALII